MVSPNTYKRYIDKLDAAISSSNVADAKDLQNEILAVFGSELDGLKRGLTNYSVVGIVTNSRTGETMVAGDDLDFIKDAKTLRSRLIMELEKVTEDEEVEEKQHRLFISHASRDAEYLVALTEMLEDVGMPDGSFVCTSVPGHGIPGGARIYDWLRDQFLTCDLRVLYALSENYYQSAACLNEMGAAWVTKATSTTLLLPGFGFGDIRGCVDSQEMGISFAMNDDELKHRLNELKDKLFEEHGLTQISQTRWERHRDKFIRTVREIAENKAKETAAEEADSGEEDHTPIVGVNNVGNIPVDVAFLLVYAAAGNGQIVRVQALGASPQISASGKQFMKDQSHKESARWQEALDTLINWGWVKATGRKGQAFELTRTGYKKAEWLKDGMQINTDNEPLVELEGLEC